MSHVEIRALRNVGLAGQTLQVGTTAMASPLDASKLIAMGAAELMHEADRDVVAAAVRRELQAQATLADTGTPRGLRMMR